jgi:hypothetical protein
MKGAAVAASGSITRPMGGEAPTGLVHAWRRGTRQTLCGVLLKGSELTTFRDVEWDDVQPVPGSDLDLQMRICPGCAAATSRDAVCRWHHPDDRHGG